MDSSLNVLFKVFWVRSDPIDRWPANGRQSRRAPPLPAGLAAKRFRRSSRTQKSNCRPLLGPQKNIPFESTDKCLGLRRRINEIVSISARAPHLHTNGPAIYFHFGYAARGRAHFPTDKSFFVAPAAAERHISALFPADVVYH